MERCSRTSTCRRCCVAASRTRRARWRRSIDAVLARLQLSPSMLRPSATSALRPDLRLTRELAGPRGARRAPAPSRERPTAAQRAWHVRTSAFWPQQLRPPLEGPHLRCGWQCGRPGSAHRHGRPVRRAPVRPYARMPARPMHDLQICSRANSRQRQNRAGPPVRRTALRMAGARGRRRSIRTVSAAAALEPPARPCARTPARPTHDAPIPSHTNSRRVPKIAPGLCRCLGGARSRRS